MSIYAYVGLPGSGKSYNVVENQILPALKQGRKVVTNIPLHEERIRETITEGEIVELPLAQIEQQPDLIEEYATPGCVLILDEVWRLFPGGQKVTHVPAAFKKLLAEHRHMVDAEGRSMQIVLVTQDLAQIGAFARQLVEETFLHKKLSALGMSGSFSCTIYRGPVTGQQPSQNLEIRTVHGRYSERVYRYYQSHTMSKSAKDGANEKSVDNRGLIWKRPIFIVIVLGLLALFPLFAYIIKPFFSPETKTSGPGATGASVATARAPIQSSFAQSPSGSHQSPVRTWRISGFIDTHDGSYALIESSDGVVSMMDASKCQRAKFVKQCEWQGQWIRFEFRPRSYPKLEEQRPMFETPTA